MIQKAIIRQNSVKKFEIFGLLNLVNLLIVEMELLYVEIYNK
jgi:hypothetical protein